MSVTCRKNKNGGHDIFIKLQHHVNHVHYSDVGMPAEAHQIIQAEAEWATPLAMAMKIQSIHPHITTSQIRAAWREQSKMHWLRDEQQLPSARKLLAEYVDDIDIFEPVDIPDGVEMLAWGMKRIAKPLKGKVVEIGMDATCELYRCKEGQYANLQHR
jgi:hypothetical protein